MKKMKVLTGTESSAERSEALLLEAAEKTGEFPDQKTGGKSLYSPVTLLSTNPFSTSFGTSRRSSIWSKKFPQSISSIKLILFLYPTASVRTLCEFKEKINKTEIIINFIPIIILQEVTKFVLVKRKQRRSFKSCNLKVLKFKVELY